MELEIQVRRAQGLIFGGSSIDPTTLELRVQCSVNGELCSSGSAKRAAKVDGYVWRGDSGVLRWHVGLADFRRLKSTRPTIKIYVFGIGSQVHTLGWFFLDLRTPESALRWVKILNSKHHGEVYVKMAVSKAPKLPPAAPSIATAIDPNVETLPPTEPECLVIGPPETAHEVFLLTITLSNARDMQPMVSRLLQKLTPAEISAIRQAGFWLAYSLFDVLVQTDVFTTLDVANFAPIRGVFRLQSCISELAAHFGAIGTLPLFLCTVDRILGRIELPLTSLATVATLPLHAPGTFSFETSRATRGTAVGTVDVTLELVQEVSTLPVEETVVVAAPPPEVPAPTLYCVVDYMELQTEQLEATTVTVATASDAAPMSWAVCVAEHRGTTFVWAEYLCWAGTGALALVTLTFGTLQVEMTPLHDVSTAVLYADDGRAQGTCYYHWTATPPTPLTATLPAEPTSVLIVRLASIKGGEDIGAVHIEFAPPLCGANPGPPLASSRVLVAAREEVDLPDSRTVLRHVRRGALAQPWELRLLSDAGDVLGAAALSLTYLTLLKEERRCDNCGETLARDAKHDHTEGVTTFTFCDVFVPLLAPETGSSVATVHVVATLQDKYPVLPQIAPPTPALASASPLRDSEPLNADDSATTADYDAPPPMPPMPPTPIVHCIVRRLLKPRSDEAPMQASVAACSCAAEVAAERRLLQEKSRELTATHTRRMEALEAEWARRDKDRVLSVRQAQQEYIALEEQLRKTLADLEARERRLAHAEETARHQAELQAAEWDATERRMKRETTVTLQSMEAQTQRLQDELSAMEARAKRAEALAASLEHDMMTVRAELRRSPEHALRQEIVRGEGVVATLEKRVRDMEAEKAKADAVQLELVQQVERLTLLLQREKRKQEEEKAGEIDKLRLKYRAREERFVLDGDREELRAIKKQLDMLREVHASARGANPEALRLHAEKTDLLQRGGYSEESPVIQELNRRIAAARQQAVRP
ncbi:hypothetical protein ACHHYP_08436 [Achlya hypogyna]|uniref:DUF3668 domain-containing protein n=1 Tax=Achlya hypogyna TaxID=1202772 RepID=A0A1V9ZKL8_ACHHY|nr:hypothetical protein ACHHYP_08436 [Achlya hypogyna]